MTERPLTAAEIDRYHADGYLPVPGLFAAAEIAPFAAALARDPTAGGKVFAITDGSRVGATEYIGWTRHGDDYLGCLTRIARIVDGAAALIGEPIYHWHSKMVRKPANGTSRIDWHQDFGGWYQDGCLRPDMLTCVVAVTPATPLNGCLTLLRGSHRMGRIDRVPDAQAYYNIHPPRLRGILDRYEAVNLPMAPGDALFFHANTVHASSPNRTADPRVLLEMSYNAVGNAPVFPGQDHHMPKPIGRLADAVLRNGAFKGVFGATPLHDLDDPTDEGYTIYHRDSVPALC